MVPILGVSGTCQVLAALAAIAILPVAMVALADRWPRRSRAASARARPSFPWPRLGWAINREALVLVRLQISTAQGITFVQSSFFDPDSDADQADADLGLESNGAAGTPRIPARASGSLSPP
ncbi:MAG: hypothetical protein N838_32320 [Thiohalocapsa sp. PB-PSB1]|nr:MAG: hypothetical protein N838_32320 [Thiohalocapsa sp. PB-PSB1]